MKTFSSCALIVAVLFASTTVGFGSRLHAILAKCIANGEKAGEAALQAACLVVESKCPTPILVEPVFSIPGGRREPYERFVIAPKRGCSALFEESCRNAAVDALFRDNDFPECRAILEYGPEPGSSTCPDFDAAVKIFKDELANICCDDGDDE